MSEIVPAPAGVWFVRTDTSGAYRWTGDRWKPVVTAASMPVGDRAADESDGVSAIAAAPSLPGRVYMSWKGYLYRSDNNGDTWTKTSFPFHAVDANDNARMWGRRMAVDPLNADYVLFGTSADGLWATTNGGDTWQKVTAVPTSSTTDSSAITGIVFAPDGVYAAVRGRGVWRQPYSTGVWSVTAGGPDGARGASVAGGIVWMVGGTDMALWRWNGTWTKIATPFGGLHAVAATGARVVVGDEAGDIAVSENSGTIWSNLDGHKTLSATDIPWLSTTGQWMSNGSMVFDPANPNRIWFSAGVGVWTALIPPGVSTVPWQSASAGIEQLVVNTITDPPGGDPIVAAWDFGLFRVTSPFTTPAVSHGPTSRFNAAWSVDWSLTDPTFLAAVVTDMRFCCMGDGQADQSGFSTDGGRTWTRFASLPAGGVTANPPWGFGSIAVSTPDNMVWVPALNQPPYYTLDRGRTWQKANLPGWVSDDGAHFAYYLNRHTVTADKATPGTFYLFHSTVGVWRTTDGGRNWTLVKSGPLQSWSMFNAKLRATPGKAGHLWFTNGPMSGADAFGAFLRSTDGGITWSAVPNVAEVRAFGFGKAAAGSSYPTVFVAGWVNNVYGIWRSTDNAGSWTQVGKFPLDQLAAVSAVEGDPDMFGRVWVGFGGNGAVFYG